MTVVWPLNRRDYLGVDDNNYLPYRSSSAVLMDYAPEVDDEDLAQLERLLFRFNWALA
jgi:hypothetical protein